MAKKNSEYVMKCRQKNYDIVTIPLIKGERETIKAHADRHGISMNEYIRQAIREKMERDNAKE